MNKRISFLNPSAAPTRPARAWSIYLEIWTKTKGLAAVMLGVIFACAAVYYLGAQSDWGITPTFEPTSAKIGFLDCLHFSVTTITTLGYGDYRPQSYSRLVAGFEALSGLILMGIFVAKLVSRQQDQLTKRLVSGQLNSEIKDFRKQLAFVLGSFRNSPPSVTSDSPSQLLHDAGALAKSIGSYWRYEATRPDLSEVIPIRATSRLIGDLITVMEAVMSNIGGRSQTTLHRKDVIAITRIAESALTAATVLRDRVADQSTAHLYDRVATLAMQFRAQLGQLPKANKSTSRTRRRLRRKEGH